MSVRYSVFTKPWKLPLPQLGEFVHSLGFDGVELPVRPGFQVEPENVSRDLPRAARLLREQGVSIDSVAGPTDEATIAACAEAGVPILRICVDIPPHESYLEAEARLQREYEALVPILDRYGVTLGIQNHCDRFVANAMQLRHLIERFDPKHIGAVWDAAHNALNGEDPELALDIVWSHLCLVNLKNAYWQRVNGPEAEVARWRHYWTTGRHGLASWPRVAAELKRRGYDGVICLTAEYSDEQAVDRLIAEDIAFAKSLFA
ncbi:MAG: sugar phosphate isomerase/epimerase [Armatimonadetes bacterium]|jgi:sugar phosphate isomerase/epimerase|nr:sugar phosphate isomerase/epimerase [Armatimonadota bacterium]